MIRKSFYNFSIVCIALGAICCIHPNEFKNIKLNSTWDPSFAIPVINSTIKVADAISNADTHNVYLNSEGYYTIIYKDTVYSDYANSLIPFLDQNLSASFKVPTAPIVSLPTGSTVNVPAFNGNFQMSLTNGMVLNHADISSGNLTLTISSDFKQDVNIEIQLSGLALNGTPIDKKYTLTWNNSTATSPITIIDNINLAGYIFTAGSNNTIPYKVTFSLSGKGNPVGANEKLTVALNTNSIKYSKWVGNPGTYGIALPEGKVQVGVFNQAIPVTDVKLVKPRITVSFINSFGIPSSFGMTKLYSTTAFDINTLRPITTSAFAPNVVLSDGLTWTGSANLNYPTNYNYPTTAYTTFFIDTTNSNIRDVVQPAPKFIHYAATASITGNSNTNFITSDSRLSIASKIELPLYGYISAYGLADTFKISLPEQKDVSQVTIRLFTNNSIPVRLNLQGYFLDSLNRRVDSLVTYSIITVPGFNNENSPVVAEPAIYDDNGNLVSSLQLLKDFVYPYSRYAKIANCKKMVLKGDIVSSKVLGAPNYNFKITPSMTMTVKISMKVDLSITP